MKGLRYAEIREVGRMVLGVEVLGAGGFSAEGIPLAEIRGVLGGRMVLVC